MVTLIVLICNKPADAVSYHLGHSFSVPGISRLDGLAWDDSTGNLFGVTAAGIDTLYEFTTSGYLVASTELAFMPGVGGSRALTYNSNTGNLHIGEIVNDRIYEITTDGVMVRSVDSPNQNPMAMTYNAVTNSLFVEAYTNTIYEINPDNGNVLNSFNAPGYNVQGLALIGTDLFAFNSTEQRIYQLSSTDGTVTGWFDVDIAYGDTGLTSDGTRIYAWDDTNDMVNVYVPEPATLLLFAFGAVMTGRKHQKV